MICWHRRRDWWLGLVGNLFWRWYSWAFSWMLSRYAGITLSRSPLCIFNVYIRWSWLLPSLNLRPWTVCVHQILAPLKVSTTLSPPAVDPHNTSIRLPLNVREFKSSKFYIFECSSTVQGFWILDLWMFKSAREMDFTSIKCSRSLPNFKHTIHLTLQFGMPDFAAILETV